MKDKMPQDDGERITAYWYRVFQRTDVGLYSYVEEKHYQREVAAFLTRHIKDGWCTLSLRQIAQRIGSDHQPMAQFMKELLGGASIQDKVNNAITILGGKTPDPFKMVREIKNVRTRIQKYTGAVLATLGYMIVERIIQPVTVEEENQ